MINAAQVNGPSEGFQAFVLGGKPTGAINIFFRRTKIAFLHIGQGHIVQGGYLVGG